MPFSFPSSPSDVFPTYLIPSLKFRRRKSSNDSNASSSSTDTTSDNAQPTNVFTPGQFPRSFLTGDSSRLKCSRCYTDLALTDQIISKGFTGRHGRAYLVSAPPFQRRIVSNKSQTARNALPDLPNTFSHKPVPRQLVTGAHTVSDISCSQCGSILGWKYLHAEEEAQKYKVGNFILETKRVCRTACWESDQDDIDPPDQIHEYPISRAIQEDEVEFDSQDEDECEELFLGLWNPKTAAQRRKSKQWTPT